jgi:hypothetical protein
MLCAVVALVPAATAVAHGKQSDSEKLQKAVDADGILRHEAVLQGIGTLANGNRLAGAPGYDASALYMALRAKAAGLKVSTHAFEYENEFLADFKAPILRVVTRASATRSSRASPARSPAATSARWSTSRARSTSRPRCGRST